MISPSTSDGTMYQSEIKNNHDVLPWDDTVADSEDSGCVFNSTEFVPRLNNAVTVESGETKRVELTANKSVGSRGSGNNNLQTSSPEMKEMCQSKHRGSGEMSGDISSIPNVKSPSSIVVSESAPSLRRSISQPSLKFSLAERIYVKDDGTKGKDTLPKIVRCHSAISSSRCRPTSLSLPRSLPVLSPRNRAINDLKNESGLARQLRRATPVKSKILSTEREKKPQLLIPIRDFDSLSTENRSNYLPILKTEDARKRNYLIGNLNGRSALLGSSELERHFPNRKLSLFVATWNLHGKITSESLGNLLLPPELEYVPDMYAVGVQEAHLNRHEWEVKLQETIGLSHVLFNSVSFGALHLAVFLRRELVWFCSVAEDSNYKLNASFNTKGVVATQFLLFGTSFLFLCSHFTAHDDKISERIEDYNKVLSNLNLSRGNLLRSRKEKKDFLDKHDCVFWFGDFNFRLNQNRDTVLRQIQRIRDQIDPNFEDLLRDDQLRHSMATGDVFKGFNEGRINFMPTYKYDAGSNLFDSSEKQRVPSYTDRILYRSRKKSTISCIFYNSAHELCSSDHKPVFGLFEILLRPGRDNVPLAAGLFKRDVYLQAAKKRAKGIEITTRSHVRLASDSAVCAIT